MRGTGTSCECICKPLYRMLIVCNVNEIFHMLQGILIGHTGLHGKRTQSLESERVYAC